MMLYIAVHTVAQNGGVSPAGKGTSLWDRW